MLFKGFAALKISVSFFNRFNACCKLIYFGVDRSFLLASHVCLRRKCIIGK